MLNKIQKFIKRTKRRPIKKVSICCTKAALALSQLGLNR